MPFKSGQVSVSTTATQVCSLGAVPDNAGVLVNSSAAVFVGGPGVTAATGFPLAVNSPQTIPTTGAESLVLYAITASGSATVSYVYPG
jgi:hypothetical protein